MICCVYMSFCDNLVFNLSLLAFICCCILVAVAVRFRIPVLC